MSMTKAQRCRQALEAELPNYSGPPLFNTAGQTNSIQTFLVNKNYEKFSTLVIAKALNMDGNIPISAERALDPNGGVVPRVTYGPVSATNPYDDANRRFGIQGAASRIIHEVDYRTLPAVAAGHCTLESPLVILMESISKQCKVVNHWDSYKTDAAKVKEAAKGILMAAEMIDITGGPSDEFLAGLGLTADQLTALAGIGDGQVAMP